MEIIRGCILKQRGIGKASQIAARNRHSAAVVYFNAGVIAPARRCIVINDAIIHRAVATVVDSSTRTRGSIADNCAISEKTRTISA